ncbi:MAG: type II toxin-antitoxin system prevent-host-death family antitoxin [Halorhodospira halophila]|uniref:Antitoxin n=1 Tax=Halorhodospira halochloris TaxID=1052 RepID=A0A110B6W3_HALHR|nr:MULTISPECIES: type II toxin-antitoxin system prevent-host-death family antitoxin [Halorhodospira]MBK1652956.1 type II toxin-antitoxin system prevent-host-death family antitoxin [Halorhodospira halochloris]MCC3751986.1 type II toxin-antitoxin system prevent-host-death family antitoxin [Halorhodospira halophila]MCG5528851.1 type II toxin-antitoxin system prevent-host-death family antitoxin [Halorhodospira halophila]MCG5534366.1 type II toxin-antitoxin system prevent-host-death family antitoxin
MTETVNIHEAKTHLSRLLDKVSQGESVIIARSGQPIARLSRFESPQPGTSERVGFLKGQIEVPDDFDRLGGQAILDAFQGEDPDASAP